MGSAWCLPSDIVLVPVLGENVESVMAIGCTRPAGRIVGGHRKPVQSRRRQQPRTSGRATRRQTGARLLPVQPLSAQLMPYDPSCIRMKIQGVLRMLSTCVGMPVGREAKTFVAKSEFSRCTSLYSSRTAFDSEDH